MTVRTLTGSDWADAERLYNELTNGPEIGGEESFARVLAHPGTQVIGAERAGRIASMVTLHLLPNVTYGGRPYGLIENVVTLKDARKQGLGRLVLQHAIDTAWAADAYKLMLLTGQARGAHGFYQALGFSSEDKWGMTLRRISPAGSNQT